MRGSEGSGDVLVLWHFVRWLAGYLGLALVFVWGGAQLGGFDFFFGGFLLVLAELWFWRGDWALGYH